MNTSASLAGTMRRTVMKSRKPKMMHGKSKGPMPGPSLKEPMVPGATATRGMKKKAKK